MDGSTTIRMLVLKGGERLPVLLDRAGQQPLFDPLVYAVSRLRGRAANTLQQHLVGLQVLLDFCSGRRIDLADRVRTGELLSFAELDGLVSSTERHRQRGDRQSVPRRLSRQTSANRLRAIRAYRETWMGYCAPDLHRAVKKSETSVRKGREIGKVDKEWPFHRFYSVLAKTMWTTSMPAPQEGITSKVWTPDGQSLGSWFEKDKIKGWITTAPTSRDAARALIRDTVAMAEKDPAKAQYHGLFLSHTGDDKPFVRKVRDDLAARGVPVWLDEAEIQIGDSLTAKIAEGIERSRYFAVFLSEKSVDAPWVQKELEIAINAEIKNQEVVVLPLVIGKCELPAFLHGKLYGDFTTDDRYDDTLEKLLRRLALQHFTSGLFLRLGKDADPAAFEPLWRSLVEYALESDWSKVRLRFYSERLICDLLGFGSETALGRLAEGAVQRMKDLYERWAADHLGADEECVKRFAHFLTTSFGAEIRLDGLRWIAAMINDKKPGNYWYRDGTGDALLEVVAASLNSDAVLLSKDAEARQALVAIAAALAAKNVLGALALQERIKLLRP